MKRIGLLFLLFLGISAFTRAQSPVTNADSTRQVTLLFEVLVSCEGQKNQVGWDFSHLDSLLTPHSLVLRGYRYDDGDPTRIYFTDRVLDSVLLYEEGNLWLSVPGHYFLEGTDSLRRISFVSEELILELCAVFQLPSAFTIGEGKYYKPIYNQNIERIELVIFDSQGLEVFATRDPDFRWDGRSAIDGQLSSPGTYFYNCDVYEKKGPKTVKRNITGMIEFSY